MLAKIEENNQWREGGLKRKHFRDGERIRRWKRRRRGGGASGGGGRGGDGSGRRGEAGERGEDGERKRRGVGGIGGRGGRGGGEEGGARKHLDALSVGYFRRVGERLSEGFTEDEERVLFV
ncbi:unnamed protein product [Coregonus sp. 'balchen']|nr:unnamed protein product [Coregonus sp. 'balchen']